MNRRKTITLAGVGVAGVALALSGVSAFAGQGDAARGGGQVLMGSGSAGSTIAFTAEGTAEAARGQVQYVDRSGEEQVVQHGTVTCIDVQGNIARVAGTWRDGGSFGLYVEDNGEGKDATDMVAVTPNLTDCVEDRGDDEPTALARGNAQVRDAG